MRRDKYCLDCGMTHYTRWLRDPETCRECGGELRDIPDNDPGPIKPEPLTSDSWADGQAANLIREARQ